MATLTDLRNDLLALSDVQSVSAFSLLKSFAGTTPPHTLWGAAVVFLDPGDSTTKTVVFRADVFDQGEVGEEAFWQNSVPDGVPALPFSDRIARKIDSVIDNGNSNPLTGRVVRGARIISIDNRLQTAEVETLEEVFATGPPLELARGTFFVGLDGAGNLDFRVIQS